MLAVKSNHYIFPLEFRIARRSIWHDLTYEHPVIFIEPHRCGKILVEIADLHSQVTTAYTSVLDQTGHDASSHVGWHGETDTLVPARTRIDRCVDPHKIHIQVNQCTTAVSRIDGCICLNEVLVGVSVQNIASSLGAYNPRCNGVIQSEWVADRQNPFTHT